MSNKEAARIWAREFFLCQPKRVFKSTTHLAVVTCGDRWIGDYSPGPIDTQKPKLNAHYYRVAEGYSNTMIELPEHEKYIVCIWGGNGPLPGAIDMARCIRSKHGESALIVLGFCTCDQDRKIRQCRELQMERIINKFHIGSDCGGDWSMAGLLEGIIEAWPS